MTCSFIVTLTLLMSEPIPQNTQGVLKVKQFAYTSFEKASRYANDAILEVGASLRDKSIPRIIGVDIVETEKFECADPKQYKPGR